MLPSDVPLIKSTRSAKTAKYVAMKMVKTAVSKFPERMLNTNIVVVFRAISVRLTTRISHDCLKY